MLVCDGRRTHLLLVLFALYLENVQWKRKEGKREEDKESYKELSNWGLS